MSKANNNFRRSARNNTVAYFEYLDRLTELSVAMFEWKNLPPEIDERYMELALFNDGSVVFFKDEELDQYLCLKVAINGNFDVYGIPKKRRAYAVNGYHRNLTDEDSVLIYNNMLHKPSLPAVRSMAKRIYDFDQTIEINVRAQKTPLLLMCDETQRLAMLNIYEQYTGNSPVIGTSKDFDTKSFSVFRTDAPYIADKLYDLKTRYWNEALTYLGISNVNVEKKERLISDEVVREMGSTIASRYSRLESRRKACQQINDMFGLDISVDFRMDYREVDDEVLITGDSEDEVSTRAIAVDINSHGGDAE